MFVLVSVIHHAPDLFFFVDNNNQAQTTISDVIQISPKDFRKPSADAIEDNIHAKYANKVLQDVGLCVCFWDLRKTSEGLISQGDGMVNVNGEQTQKTSQRNVW
jgi:hypothetical protein